MNLNQWAYRWSYISYATLWVRYILLEPNLVSIACICLRTSPASLSKVFILCLNMVISLTIAVWSLIDMCQHILIVPFLIRKVLDFKSLTSFKTYFWNFLGQKKAHFPMLCFTVHINIWFWPILISSFFSRQVGISSRVGRKFSLTSGTSDEVLISSPVFLNC